MTAALGTTEITQTHTPSISYLYKTLGNDNARFSPQYGVITTMVEIMTAPHPIQGGSKK